MQSWIESLVVALALTLAVPAAGEAPAAAARPNFVFILADDLGWRDTGFMGSTFYETPNIDRLAREGLVFRDAYANAPNCAPTRASLLSGQYTPRHGILTVAPSARGDSKQRKLLVPETATELPLEVVTLAESLQAAGYATASIGKWHLGRRGYSPVDQGFGFSIAGNARGIAPSYFWPYEFVNRRGITFRIASLRERGHEGEYLTDRLTDEAIRWLDAHAAEPFFLYLSHYAVHTPIQAKPELEAKYRAKEASGGHGDARYAAMVESLDESVGRVLQQLEKLDVADDTVVVFFSDNGGAGAVTSMRPLRGTKGMLYEGGIREPLVVRWPGHIAAGAETDVPVIGVDFYPTFLELAGVTPPPGQVLDGASLGSLLFSRDASALRKRSLYWHFPAYLDAPAGEPRPFRTTPAGAIRSGDFKLIEFFEDGRLELYDLRRDLGEQTNLAKTHPAKARELHADLQQWRTEVRAAVPTKRNPEYRELRGVGVD
jgi:arylsulfatase A-like enzyme